MSIDLLQRLYQKRDAKQQQIASLHAELEHLEIAIAVIEHEEGMATRNINAASTNGNGAGISGSPLFIEGDEGQIGPTAIVLQTVRDNANRGVLPNQIIKAVQQQIPGAKPKYIYTVIGRQVNKTKRIKREGKRLFPA